MCDTWNYEADFNGKQSYQSVSAWVDSLVYNQKTEEVQMTRTITNTPTSLICHHVRHRPDVYDRPAGSSALCGAV